MFAIGDQLPMFVDVAELADAIDEGLVFSGDVRDSDVDARAMFDRKAEECEDFRDEYVTALEDTAPTLVGLSIASLLGIDPEVGMKDVSIEDGHHRLAAWAARGQLAPVMFTDDIDEIYRSVDDGPCY